MVWFASFEGDVLPLDQLGIPFKLHSWSGEPTFMSLHWLEHRPLKCSQFCIILTTRWEEECQRFLEDCWGRGRLLSGKSVEGQAGDREAFCDVSESIKLLYPFRKVLRDKYSECWGGNGVDRFSFSLRRAIGNLTGYGVGDLGLATPRQPLHPRPNHLWGIFVQIQMQIQSS